MTTQSRTARARRLGLLVAAGAVALTAVAAGTAGVQALITGAQIKDGTIESRDVKDGALARTDLSPALVRSLRAGGGGVSGYRLVRGTAVAVGEGLVEAVAPCPAGTVVLGGGMSVTAPEADYVVVDGQPTFVDGSYGWSGRIWSFEAGFEVTAYATCVDAPRP